MPGQPCPICRSPTAAAGTKRGDRTGRTFALRRCPACGFAFVADPLTDWAQVYDQTYYAGRGSDPLIDYAFEFEHPAESIRQYEWRGWERMMRHLRPENPAPDWLDFGCGCGTLVRYLRGHGGSGAVGFDTGAWAEKARRSGVPILDEAQLEARAGGFDVVTAIDVIEHVPDPVGLLRRLRRLVRPGGILVALTQNAEIAPRDFPAWSYVRPEIHVSFFTPRSLSEAMRQAGFEPFPAGPPPGWGDLMRCRILKNLRVRRPGIWERMLPWPLLVRLADARVKMAALPFGRAV